MSPTLHSRAAAWRDRVLARWRRPSLEAPRSPYRVAARPPRVRAARRSPLRSTFAALRALWTAERLGWILGAVGVGACAVGCFVVLEQAAHLAAPRVSTPITHALALPFGILVGLIAALVFLAFGAAVMAVGAMFLTSLAYALTGLARTAWNLLVVLPREFFARDDG